MRFTRQEGNKAREAEALSLHSVVMIFRLPLFFWLSFFNQNICHLWNKLPMEFEKKLAVYVVCGIIIGLIGFLISKKGLIGFMPLSNL
jgi:hypothetical protein